MQWRGSSHDVAAIRHPNRLMTETHAEQRAWSARTDG